MLSKKIRTRRPHERPRRKLVVPQWVAEAVLVFLFCCAFGWMVYRFASVSSATYDETTHLVSGYSYWKWDDYRMNPEHPPLLKKLAALPLLTRTVRPDTVALREGDEENRAVTTTERSMRRFWALGLQNIDMQWHFAHGLLFGINESAQVRMRIPHHYQVAGDLKLEKSDFLNDGQDLLFWGRMPILLLGCALLALVYLWGRQMFGVAGGVLAMALICFDPNFIAHSGLVTTDVGVTLFMFGAMFFLWCAFRRLEVWSVALFVLFFALAFASKFSAVLLAPFFWLVALGRIFSAKEWAVGAKGDRAIGSWPARAGAVFGLFAGACLTAFFVIWASYGLRFAAAKDPQRAARDEALVLASLQQPESRPAPPPAGEDKPQPEAPPQGSPAAEGAGPPRREALAFDRKPGRLPLEMVLHRTVAVKTLLPHYPQGIPEVMVRQQMDNVTLGLTERLILFARDWRLLPEAYLYGFAHARMKSLMRSAFLRGEYSATGFRSYFLWTFLLKTPLPALLLIAAAIIIAARRRLPWRSRAAFIAVPVMLYLIMSVTSNLNIGHRHLLPIYPFLYVLCGIVAAEWRRWRFSTRRWTAVALAVILPASCWFVFAPPWGPQTVHPHYLAYFNELGGGPKNGYKSLVDSNLDWGQDLIRLSDWLDKRKQHLHQPIILSYFGMGDPRFYGIPHLNAPHELGGYSYELAPDPGEFIRGINEGRYDGSYFAVSATNLSGVYGKQMHDVWQQIIRRSTYIDHVGYSIYIFRLDGSKQRPAMAAPSR